MAIGLDNITTITARSTELAGSAPSVEQIIQNSRPDTRKIIAELQETVPTGFKLAVVAYERSGKPHENEAIFAEYIATIRPALMQYLAQNCADLMISRGVSATGLEIMRQGGDPVNEQGLPIPMNVDHIIERAGCGSYGRIKAKDPLLANLDGDFPETFQVNHLDNLILLNRSEHDFKNRLMDAQVKQIPHGGKAWIISMVPDRAIMGNQPVMRQHTSPENTPELSVQFATAKKQAEIAARAFDTLRKDSDYQKLMADIKKAANKAQLPVEKIIACMVRSVDRLPDSRNDTIRKSLLQDFNGLIKNRPELAQSLEEGCTALDKYRLILQKTAEQARMEGNSAREQEIRSYNHSLARIFSNKLGDMVIAEGQSLETALQECERSINIALKKSHYAQPGKPVLNHKAGIMK